MYTELKRVSLTTGGIQGGQGKLPPRRTLSKQGRDARAQGDAQPTYRVDM